ncbi:glycosyltransferase family 4 protein [Halobacterium salinarum]|uniref:glycosyltransferase family 4 protein n=1 Tax=Halobacterium salinarum TaxID=2242 RepID=UPI0030D269D8
MTDGAKLRIYNTAKLLSKHYCVDLLITEVELPDQSSIDTLESEFNNVYIFQHSKWEFRRNIARSLISKRPAHSYYHIFDDVVDWIDDKTRYDLYYGTYIHSAEYLRDQQEPSVIDLVDSMSRNLLARAANSSTLKRPMYYLEGKKLQKYEQKLLMDFNKIFVISASEKNFIKSDKNDISIIPNGVKNKYLQYDPSSGSNPSDKTIVAFFGKMDYLPNVDAVVHFANNIMPKITRTHPNVQFRIIGADPSKKVQKLSNKDNVEVTGFVEDPPRHITNADITVAPMRLGTGVQNKILESMALSQPIVTTPLGQEGIMSSHRKHLLVGESDDEFAKLTKELIESENDRTRIGRNARNLIDNQYTWSSVESELVESIGLIL